LLGSLATVDSPLTELELAELEALIDAATIYHHGAIAPSADIAFTELVHTRRKRSLLVPRSTNG
jgi:hypothetical protein